MFGSLPNSSRTTAGCFTALVDCLERHQELALAHGWGRQAGFESRYPLLECFPVLPWLLADSEPSVRTQGQTWLIWGLFSPWPRG